MSMVYTSVLLACYYSAFTKFETLAHPTYSAALQHAWAQSPWVQRLYAGLLEPQAVGTACMARMHARHGGSIVSHES